MFTTLSPQRTLNVFLASDVFFSKVFSFIISVWSGSKRKV